MKNAFTLIELLVVIAIISTLTAVLLPNFMESRQRARDIQRKADLKQLQTALELYKQNQTPQVYPSPPVGANTLGVACSAWTVSGITYMNKIPKDPATTCSSPKTYFYSYSSSDPTTFTLSACLENTADPEGVSCPGSYVCSSQKCYQVTQP